MFYEIRSFLSKLAFLAALFLILGALACITFFSIESEHRTRMDSIESRKEVYEDVYGENNRFDSLAQDTSIFP